MRPTDTSSTIIIVLSPPPPIRPKSRNKRDTWVCIFDSAVPNTHADFPFQELSKVNMVTIWRQLHHVHPFKYNSRWRRDRQTYMWVREWHNISFLAHLTLQLVADLNNCWSIFISYNHMVNLTRFSAIYWHPILHKYLTHFSLLLKMPQHPPRPMSVQCGRALETKLQPNDYKLPHCDVTDPPPDDSLIAINNTLYVSHSARNGLAKINSWLLNDRSVVV